MSQKLLHANVFGEGKPFLILHGFLGMGDNWKTLGKQFAKDGYQVHLVDQRNHGRSFHDEVFNYEALAEDLKRYCEYHDLSKIYILGHSMGGKTAMLFAALYPELIEKLIVADIAPRYYPVHHDQILKGLSSLNFIKITSRSEADKQLAAYVPEFGTRQFLLKNLYWVTKGQLGLRINLEVLKDNVSEVGESLPSEKIFNKPTLFLRGDRSEYISENDTVGIRRQFPEARIETIANAGHWLHAENPKAFYEEVINFLS
ncbi:MAG: alpha/beta fold hydrolase [bacterium]